MTTSDDTPFDPESGYLQLGVPGVPYSAVRVPLSGRLEVDEKWVTHAMLVAELAAKAYAEEFPETPHEPPPRAQGQAPQQGAPRQAQRPQTRPAAGLDARLVVAGNCPEHGVPARPSTLQYQQIEVTDEGVERYAKYFCPGRENGTGQNHSLWARELVSA